MDTPSAPRSCMQGQPIQLGCSETECRFPLGNRSTAVSPNRRLTGRRLGRSIGVKVNGPKQWQIYSSSANQFSTMRQGEAHCSRYHFGRSTRDISRTISPRWFHRSIHQRCALYRSKLDEYGRVPLCAADLRVRRAYRKIFPLKSGACLLKTGYLRL